MTLEPQFTLDDEKLFEEIKRGRTFDKGDKLPPLYEKHLKNLLWMQADSEYSGSLGYVPWIHKAPTLMEKVLVAQIAKDEMRHAQVIYKILDNLGEDTISHINRHELDYKLEDDLIQIGFKRLKDDYRVNIFYYSITYWTDFILFNFLMDRAAGHQLEDTLESSYLPWKEGIVGIYKEETMHVAHGDKWIKKLANDPDEKPFLQERLNLWWPRVLNVFGNAKGASNPIYVKLGLKKRTNLEVRQVFMDEIKGITDECGLTLPEYHTFESH
jgi:ring-1,2-phenylacetyl-CoA epoxidase subunit PaaA